MIQGQRPKTPPGTPSARQRRPVAVWAATGLCYLTAVSAGLGAIRLFFSSFGTGTVAGGVVIFLAAMCVAALTVGYWVMARRLWSGGAGARFALSALSGIGMIVGFVDLGQGDGWEVIALGVTATLIFLLWQQPSCRDYFEDVPGRRFDRWWSLCAAGTAWLAVIAALVAAVYPPSRDALVTAVGINVDASTTGAPAPRLPASQPRRLGYAWGSSFSRTYEDGTTIADPVMASGGYLAVATTDGVQVRNVSDGRERWHYVDRLARLNLSVTPIALDGRDLAVVLAPAGSSHDRLILFDARTGRQQWAAWVPRQAYHPLLEPSRVILVPAAGTPGAVMVAVVRSTGRTAWTYPVAGCRGAALIGGHDSGLLLAGNAPGRVIVETSCGPDTSRLRSLDQATGRVIWDRRYGGAAPGLAGCLYQCPPAQRPGQLTDVVTPGGTMAEIDGETGRVAGRARLPGGRVFAVPGGWCVVGSRTACYDTRGRARWQRPLPRPGFRGGSGLLATVADGDLAVVVRGPHSRWSFAALNIRSGRWVTPPTTLPGGFPDFSIVSYGRAGLVLLNTGSVGYSPGTGRLEVFGPQATGKGEPAATAWPGFTAPQATASPSPSPSPAGGFSFPTPAPLRGPAVSLGRLVRVSWGIAAVPLAARVTITGPPRFPRSLGASVSPIGGRYLVLRATVVNSGPNTEFLSSANFGVLTRSGHFIVVDPWVTAGFPPQARLAPGQSVTGIIAFDPAVRHGTVLFTSPSRVLARWSF